MAILKCKMCGGELNIIDESMTVCECEYCGSKQTIPKADDEKKIKLYERANRLRMANEFDKAAAVYEGIIEEDDSEAEAYWGLMLCKYGIEYVDDPATGDKIPTCHRSSFDSFMDDSDFDMVMNNSDTVSRSVYREQAKQIEEIRKGIIEVSGKEAPYDIFICYKETDDNGDRTVDSVIAQDVYDALTGKGYRVFFSRISLEDKLGQEYEPYIFAALNSAKIMLAFGTSYDYYNAVWVKNEWSRFIKLMAKDKNKNLIPCFKNIDAYDMPKEFKHLQAQDMEKVGAIQDLIRGIDKILNPKGRETATVGTISSVNQQDIRVAVESAMTTQINNNVGVLLERGFMALEDGDFEKADEIFDDALKQNPKSAEAYMGKLMAYYGIENTRSFAEKIFEAYFSEFREKKIEFGYDIHDLLEEHYCLFGKIDVVTMKSIKNAFDVSIETKLDCLNRFDKLNDYIKEYCTVDDDFESSSELDAKYYRRYLQYATEDIYNKFDVNNQLQDIIEKAKVSEDKKVQEICDKFSKDKMLKIIEDSNLKIKAIVGDEIDQIESEYQSELSRWKIECEAITSDWPTKRQEIQANWRAECETIKQQYEQKKKEVDENNQRVKQTYQQAIDCYEIELTGIDNRISDLNRELAGLGLFRGKQKKEINNDIMILESKKINLQKPVLASYGKLMVEPQLVLPKQPDDSEIPILPTKPIRKEMNRKVDAKGILREAFEKKKITIDNCIIELGNYKGKPITWIILDYKEDKALLLSEYALDVVKYNENFGSATWEKCTLRKWLNNEFLNEALRSEKERICLAKVSADSNPKYDTNTGNDTDDRIFLLSIKEVNDYFSDNNKRICYPTEYVKTKMRNLKNASNNLSPDGTCWWWLRSPGSASRSASNVYVNGSVNLDGNFVIANSVGVRPALWIKHETLVFKFKKYIL